MPPAVPVPRDIEVRGLAVEHEVVRRDHIADLVVRKADNNGVPAENLQQRRGIERLRAAARGVVRAEIAAVDKLGKYLAGEQEQR